MSPITSWILLILAGVFEVTWALGLKVSHGLGQTWASLVTILFMILSLYFLAIASRHIPISIAYVVWVGIGAVGAFLGGVFLFDEKVSSAQVLFFVIVIIGLIGLKIASIKL